jgi:hypothetical protein
MPNIRIVKFALVAGLCVFGASVLRANGPVGVFALVDKVVFEPNEANAERIQVWGAFVFVEGGVKAANQTSAARKGYMYFQLFDAALTAAQRQAVRNEWNDLKTVAGTGQAVGFGNYFYLGGFGELDPAARTNGILQNPSGTGSIRVRPASEPPSAPSAYTLNIGVVKLSTEGTQGAAVQKLKDALAAK